MSSGETARTAAPGLMGRAVQLGVSVDALAALAAQLRLETEGLDADPEVRRLLADIANEVTGAAPVVADGLAGARPRPFAAAPGANRSLLPRGRHLQRRLLRPIAPYLSQEAMRTISRRAPR